jgi:hypothetical protein
MNKSYYYFDAFVCYFIIILQKCSVQLSRLPQFVYGKHVRKSGSKAPLIYTVLEIFSNLQGDNNVKYVFY